MNGITKKAVFVLALGLVIGWVSAQPASAQSAQQKASQAFKNLKLFGDLPGDQLLTTMQFFEGSLGVACDFCHAADRTVDTPKKEMARKMIQMVRTANRDTF